MEIKIKKWRLDPVYGRDVDGGNMTIIPTDEYGEFVEIDGEKVKTEELIQSLKAIQRPQLCSNPY